MHPERYPEVHSNAHSPRHPARHSAERLEERPERHMEEYPQEYSKKLMAASAIRRSRTQCERGRRTLSSAAQATVETDTPLRG